METKHYDLGLERAVLSGLFQYGVEAYVEIQDIISESDFYNHQNAIIYRCLKYIVEHNLSVDTVSITSAANTLSLKDEILSDTEFLKSLKTLNVNKDNVSEFAIQVKKLSFIRDLLVETKKVVDNLSKISSQETIDNIIDAVEKPIINAVSLGSTNKKPEILGDDILQYVKFLGENPCDVVGIPTGFPRFDKSIGGGLRRKTVNVISARPKVGKSYIADAISINVTNEDIPVLMLDTEMSKEDHSHRMLAMISGVKLNDIENGSFARDEISKDKVIKAAEKLSKLKYYYINVAGEPFNIIANQIKRWVIQTVGKDENGKTNDCLVIYDYLKLMTSNNISANLQEYQALGFQISELHNLCVRLDIPCLSFVQLNREGETKESTDVVSGSDRIVWLCTSFTIFKHKTLEEMAEDGKIVCTRKLVPIVSRHGAGLDYGDYINIKFDGSIGLIKEHKTRNELKRSLGDKGMLEDGEINKVDIKIE